MNDLSFPLARTPLPVAPPAAALSRGVHGAPRRPKQLVLVVDDDPVMREMLQITLQDDGFEVEAAGDGAEGLRRFECARPDIVITDATMPVMDGFAFCEALRARPAGRHVPILMLTAAEDSASIRRAFTSGATDFATKPLQEDLIAHRLRYLLQASRNLRELARSESRLANAQRIGRIGNWDLEIANDAMVISAEACRIIGSTQAQCPSSGTGYLVFIHPEDRPAVIHWMAETIRTGQASSFEYRIVRPDGGLRHALAQAEIVADDDGQAVQVSGTVQDISDRKQAEEQIRYLAMYDGLTGLPNRRLCAEQLDGALARAGRHGTPVAVMIIGLDSFKQINEAHGNATGDALLIKIGERLKRNMRQGDHVARVDTAGSPLEGVARLGGDTFAVTLTELGQAEDAATAAARVQEYLAQPCFIGGESLFVTACVGIAVYPVDGDNVQDLLKNAESAMHAAKLHRHNGLRFFTAAMNAGAARKLAMANDLRTAIGSGQFSLHFQPQVALDCGRITGAEALIRWMHPRHGMVSPAEFIPLAEELGLIVQLGEWAATMACVTARTWQQAGKPPVRVAVNVSPKQFREPGFMQMIARVLAQTGLEPHCLELEVTEGIMIGDPDAAIEIMRAFRDMGVQLAIDDFGTGYSSLSYLKLFPIQRLKIDQSFVRELEHDEQSAAIVHTVIVLGHALNLKVTAEGVETPAHAARLRALGCDELQGYLIARPLPADQFHQMLRSDWRMRE